MKFKHQANRILYDFKFPCGILSADYFLFRFSIKQAYLVDVILFTSVYPQKIVLPQRFVLKNLS